MVTVVTKTQIPLIVQIHSIFGCILLNCILIPQSLQIQWFFPKVTAILFFGDLFCLREIFKIFFCQPPRNSFDYFSKNFHKILNLYLSVRLRHWLVERKHFLTTWDRYWQQNHHFYLFVHCSVHQAFVVTSYWRHFLYKYDQNDVK